MGEYLSPAVAADALFRRWHFYYGDDRYENPVGVIVGTGNTAILVLRPDVPVVCDGRTYRWPDADGAVAEFAVTQVDLAAHAVGQRLLAHQDNTCCCAGQQDADPAGQELRRLQHWALDAMGGDDRHWGELARAVLALTAVCASALAHRHNPAQAGNRITHALALCGLATERPAQ